MNDDKVMDIDVSSSVAQRDSSVMGEFFVNIMWDTFFMYRLHVIEEMHFFGESLLKILPGNKLF
jgi:hypothetical protein